MLKKIFFFNFKLEQRYNEMKKYKKIKERLF